MKTKILILGLALAAAASPPGAPKSSSLENRAAPAGAVFSFEQKMDTGAVKGKMVIVPGALLYTWSDGKGKAITWDAATGAVLKGDSAVSFVNFRFMAGFFFDRLKEISTFHNSRDSAASAAMERAWAILNPKRE